MEYFTKKEIEHISNSLHIEEGTTDEIWAYFEDLVNDYIVEEVINRWESGKIEIDTPYGPRNKYNLTMGDNAS